jgi:hypothetical protein
MATSGASGWRTARARSFVVVAALAVLAATLAPHPAGARQERARTGAAAAVHLHTGRTGSGASFDSRAGGSPVVRGAAVLRAQRALARSLGPQGLVDVDERTGTPRTIARLDGFLTGPSAAAPAAVALGYVRTHLPAFGITLRDLAGLRLARDYVDILGTHHLVWEQRFRGLTAWDNDLRAHVTSVGRLVAVGGSPMPGLSVPSVVPRLSPRDAIAASYRSVGVAVPSLGAPTRSSPRPDRETLFGSGNDARLVLFGTSRGARLAWRTTVAVSTQEVDLSIVDATTGEVLWRANMVKSDDPGTGQAWEYYPSASVPNGGGVQHQVTFPVADGTSLFGNNAWTYPDVDDDNSPDREIPATSGLDWSYPATLNTSDSSNACSVAFPCSWQPGVPFSWGAHVQADAVQVFHFLNTFHDHLLAPPIGFTEAAGNFQVDNSSGLGLDGDPVVANVLDGADTRPNHPGLPDGNHVLNANMLTPPDGSVPLMQMYLFPSIPGAGVPATTGGDDASVVYHEYTHGLSNRLVTFADGSGALNSAQAGAMGEAWSDFYAMDFLATQGYEPDTAAPDVIVGRYVGGGRPDFLRSEAIDCRVGSSEPNCPGAVETGPGGYTYGNFGHVATGPEVHSDGEIWVQTLWDIRTALGSAVTLALVTRAMELSPPEPSFLDMRNAILEADQVAFGGSHSDDLWQLFAHRGMGFFAVAVDGSDVHPAQDFGIPPTCPGDCGTVNGTVVDSQTGAPVAGVNVAVAGHASGFGGDLVDATDGDGAFSIANVPFHDYVLTVQSDRHEPVSMPVNVNGVETVQLQLTRDWAALGGGASLVHFTGPDYSPSCGPSFAWDTSLSTGWGSDAVGSTVGSDTTGPRINIVRLPRAVDISAFGFAANGTCGDGPESAVRVFKIQTRTRKGDWKTAYQRSAALPLGVMNTLLPQRGTRQNVRFVKLIMLDNYGDPLFMDVLELSVRGIPA